MNTRFAADRPVFLEVDLVNGLLELTTDDTGVVEVAIEGPRADEFRVEEHGSRIVIRSPRDRGWLLGGGRHEVRVGLPTGSDLHARVGSADVTARGEYGEVSVKCGSGDVVVGDTGRLAVLSGSGRVHAGHVQRDLRVKTGSGDITLASVQGSGAIGTGSGRVRLGHVAGRVTVKTGSGDVRAETLDGDLTCTTASGELSIDHAVDGKVVARSASGDVRVGVAPGTPVWTEIYTATGRVASQLPPVGPPTAGQASVQVVVQSATGDVLLMPAGPAPWGSDHSAVSPQDAPHPWPQDARTGSGPQDAPA